MNGVFIIPTGIGCEIGGHAGDATPAAKLVASVCDNLLVHPNVVNASDINEMTENMWYIEGSMLDALLKDTYRLQKPRKNKILLVVNAPVTNEIINSVSAARATIGAYIEILVLDSPLSMLATKTSFGIADGLVSGWEELVEQVKKRDFDALAIASKIDIDINVALDYIKYGGVNPWGAVEARASRLIATRLGKPVAHAPFGHTLKDFDETVDPRMAAEFVSVSYLHCILKGLHKAPRISSEGLSVYDIDFLVSPFGCYGTPHKECVENDIPIIVVKENNTICNDYDLTTIPKDFILVNNYLEAVGVICALKEGLTLESVQRPLPYTTIIRKGVLK